MDRVPSTEPPSAAATEQLLAHTEWLRRVARALTTNAEDADDVVQQTWLAAIERPPAHAGNLRGWLATLARNLVRSRRRSRERETARTHALPPPPPAPTPAESVARAELQQAVLDAVLALEEPYRATLVQRYCDELSADEIARRSGVPVETVRTRVKRGLDQVRGNVARKLGGEQEQLAALLAPLIGGGVVATGAKVGWFVGIAALALASTTLVIRIARHEGGARESVAAVAPAGAANGTEPALAAARQTDAPAPPIDAAPDSAASVAKEFDVTGTVIDSGGAPIADATVVLFDRPRDRRPNWSELLEKFESPRARRMSGEDGTVRSTTTDAQGLFHLASVERAHPRCIAAHHPAKGTSEVFDVEPPDTNESRPISLALRPGISVHGRIVDADGRAVEHAKLTVSTGSVFMGGTSEFDAGSGTFSIPPIPVTELTLTATDDAERHRSPPLTLRADEGEAVREVTLRLERAPYSVKLHGRVLGPDHEPLVATHPFFRSGAAEASEDARRSKVRVWAVTGETPALGSAHTYIAVGWNSFDARRGEYTCTVALSDEDDFRPTCLVAEYRDRVVATMSLDEALLEPTEETHEVPDLVIAAPTKSLEPIYATLDVRVVDAANGQLLEGSTDLTVLARLDAGPTSKVGGTGPSRRSQRILPSRASIVANCRGYVADWVDGDFAARAEPYPVTVALQRAVRAVRGEVLDPERKPVAGARVCWLGEKDGSFRGTAVEPVLTDASGRFEFVAVGASRGRVAVEAEHLVPAFSDVAAGTEDASARIELARGVPVTFTASPDAKGNDLPGVLLIAHLDGTIVRDEWDLRYSRFDRPWPKTITLAPSTYRYHVDFVTRADADGEFTASEGAEVRVTPRAR
jgi:RNA polymerase sigma-70 factor (ECF subfamily)